MNLTEELMKGFEFLSDEELGMKTRRLLKEMIAEKIQKVKAQKDIEQKQKNCKHENTHYGVSEYHQNGKPDRWYEVCKDCGKMLAE